MKKKLVKKEVYCCQTCSYESENSTMFNTCVVCKKSYCILNCKNDLYLVYNQQICRICKENPMVEVEVEKWLLIWRKDLRHAIMGLEKIRSKALTLDKRFTKGWEKNLKKYEDKQKKEEKHNENS